MSRSWFFCRKINSLLLCAAVLAVGGVFGNFLSAVVAEHSFPFRFCVGLGLVCVGYGAHHRLDIVLVGVEHNAVDFGGEFGHKRHDEGEEGQKHRCHCTDCSDDCERHCRAVGEKRLLFVVKERPCGYERVDAERKENYGDYERKAPHDARGFDDFIQVFFVVYCFHNSPHTSC